MLDHFMTGDVDGALYDLREWVNGISGVNPLRPNYCRHHESIDSVADLKATLRAGPYVWPGGYPLFFLANDSGAICFKCARAEFRNIADSIVTDTRDGWKVEHCGINWEDSSLMCGHCAESIESAYGEN